MTKKCLVIDDVEVTRYTCRLFLEEMEFKVEEAQSPEDGLARAKDMRPDVVFLDWHLRKESGLDLISQMKKDAPGAKIIVMTGVESRDKENEAIKAGADGFTLKPTTEESLTKKLKEVGVL